MTHNADLDQMMYNYRLITFNVTGNTNLDHTPHSSKFFCNIVASIGGFVVVKIITNISNDTHRLAFINNNNQHSDV